MSRSGRAPRQQSDPGLRPRPMSDRKRVSHLPPGVRPVRLDDKPTVSVVVACRKTESLGACLDSLAEHCFRHRTEVVVAGAIPDLEVDRLRLRYPSVKWVLTDFEADVSQLRRLGLAAAKGDIVAL